MSYQSFSQTDTKTQLNKDTTVMVIPTKVVSLMVDDIKSSIKKDEQIIDLKSELKRNQERLVYQDSVNAKLMGEIIPCKSSLEEYITIDAVNQNTINGLRTTSKKYKHQRNALGGFGAILLILVVL